MTKQITFEESDIAKKLASYKFPRYDELPAFPLVMRQLINLLDKYLSIFIIPGEEKPLTQSMINSYVYKKIIDAPINKEYNKELIIHLLCIGILKQIFSINEVGQLIEAQAALYPVDVAYNYFCTELEDALKITFGSRDFSQLKKSRYDTPLSETARSVVLAFANKVYVKQSFYFAEQQLQNKN